MDFKALGVSDALAEHLSSELGFTDATPIQERCIPPLLQGRDIVGKAETGSGKTLAFGIPLIDKLEASRVSILALAICPTRELAQQVARDLEIAGKGKGLKVALVTGGVHVRTQRRGIPGKQIVVGTPGRIKDLLDDRLLAVEWVEFFVLDEFDRLLDMGFVDDVKAIVARLPKDRQTALFSATVPQSLMKHANPMLRNPVMVEIGSGITTVARAVQRAIRTKSSRKLAILEKLLTEGDQSEETFIIFCNTKRQVRQLDRELWVKSFSVASLSGDYDQSVRFKVMERFRNGEIRVLVATDVAARGLDIDHVGHVVNFDVPFDVEDYVHRIGRTARAGRSGIVTTLVGDEDYQSFERIRRELDQKIEMISEPGKEPLESARPRDDEERDGAESEAGNETERGSRSRRGSRRGRGSRNERPEAAAEANVEEQDDVRPAPAPRAAVVEEEDDGPSASRGAVNDDDPLPKRRRGRRDRTTPSDGDAGSDRGDETRPARRESVADGRGARDDRGATTRNQRDDRDAAARTEPAGDERGGRRSRSQRPRDGRGADATETRGRTDEPQRDRESARGGRDRDAEDGNRPRKSETARGAGDDRDARPSRSGRGRRGGRGGRARSSNEPESMISGESDDLDLVGPEPTRRGVGRRNRTDYKRWEEEQLNKPVDLIEDNWDQVDDIDRVRLPGEDDPAPTEGRSASRGGSRRGGRGRQESADSPAREKSESAPSNERSESRRGGAGRSRRGRRGGSGGGQGGNARRRDGGGRQEQTPDRDGNEPRRERGQERQGGNAPRDRKPDRDGNARRERSPDRGSNARRERSPDRDGNTRRPDRDGNTRSPDRDGNTRRPDRDGNAQRDRAPDRDGNTRRPDRDGNAQRDRNPDRDGNTRRERSPDRDGGNAQRDRNPDRDGNTRRERGPDRDGGEARRERNPDRGGDAPRREPRDGGESRGSSPEREPKSPRPAPARRSSGSDDAGDVIWD